MQFRQNSAEWPKRCTVYPWTRTQTICAISLFLWLVSRHCYLRRKKRNSNIRNVPKYLIPENGAYKKPVMQYWLTTCLSSSLICLSLSPWQVQPPAPWCGSPWDQAGTAASPCAPWLPWSAAAGPTFLSLGGLSLWPAPLLHPRSPSRHTDPDGLVHTSSTTKQNDSNRKAVALSVLPC